jgi:hypothetical protein
VLQPQTEHGRLAGTRSLCPACMCVTVLLIAKDWSASCADGSSLCRYLSSMLFQSIRAECAQMDINERVLLTDEAGKSFYVPEL